MEAIISMKWMLQLQEMPMTVNISQVVAITDNTTYHLDTVHDQTTIGQ